MNESLKRQHYEPTLDRRGAIARAARELIVEKGFEGLRTRDIAERVGINIATLHYHIPGKEALIGLVTESIRSEFIAQYYSRPREGLSAEEQLRLEFVDFREMRETSPQAFLVLSELVVRGRRDDNVRGAIAPMQRKWREMIAQILRDGQSEGAFRADLDPDAGARMIIGAMIGFGQAADATQEAFDRLESEICRAIRVRPDRQKEELK
jgi:AcrR family transcriptional regulator